MTAKSWSQARFWTRVEALGARWEWLQRRRLRIHIALKSVNFLGIGRIVLEVHI